MTVANELDAVIEELAVNQRQAARELVEEIRTRPGRPIARFERTD